MLDPLQCCLAGLGPPKEPRVTYDPSEVAPEQDCNGEAEREEKHPAWTDPLYDLSESSQRRSEVEYL